MLPRAIGICGLGQIGLPLAVVCWRSGFHVLLFDRDAGKVDSALAGLYELDAWMSNELPELKPRHGILELVDRAVALAEGTDLIFECIAEQMDAKVELLRCLATAGTQDAILCSCTSGLSVSALGEQTGCAHRLVGTHFWNPPHLIPLVEVVSTAETSEQAVNTAVSVCKRLGKRPVRIRHDVPGFVGNRILHAMWREAIHIVESGIATPEDVDVVVKLTIGLRLAVFGPFEHMDIVGLDLVRTIHTYLLADLAANQGPNKLLEQLVSEGRVGAKAGRGFLDWTTRDPAEVVERRDRQIVREIRRQHQ